MGDTGVDTRETQPVRCNLGEGKGEGETFFYNLSLPSANLSPRLVRPRRGHHIPPLKPPSGPLFAKGPRLSSQSLAPAARAAPASVFRKGCGAPAEAQVSPEASPKVVETGSPGLGRP